MPSYRLYRLDGAGKITTAEWIDAADDQQAEQQARAGAGLGACEVWDRNRLVIRVGATDRPPGR